MAPARFGVRSLDLGQGQIDAPLALERWLALEGSSAGFLIEKSEPGESLVFLGVAPFETLRVLRGKVVQETKRGRKIISGNPFSALGRRLADFRIHGRFRPFSTGAVGSLGYEMVRHLENIPGRSLAQEGFLMLFDRIAVWDRVRGRGELFVLQPRRKGAAAREAVMPKALRAVPVLRSCRLSPPGLEAGPPRSRRMVFSGAPPRGPGEACLDGGALGRTGFLRAARRIKEHIRAGDIFQCVLSERFAAPVKAGPLEIYRSLRLTSPSPYLFFIKDGEGHLLGASPERLVKVVEGTAWNCPIAGTRPRGADPRRDGLLERALKRSPKERAEHLMLVDLARNDLGRVCRPGSVKLRRLMEVRRFSNVMHLVSEVEGRLERGRSSWDALAASFPAGTVSGAPKVRAMEILSGLEPGPRGFYAGAVLQSDFSGNLDSCIAIRTMSIGGGRAVLQAGAGIVADSRPEREYEEVENKLSSLRRALALAGSS